MTVASVVGMGNVSDAIREAGAMDDADYVDACIAHLLDENS